MKKILILSLIMAATVRMAIAQISDYRPGVTTDGAVYFLPKTAIRVAVKVEKTQYTPGDFCKYARRYLRLDNVNESPSTSHRILSCDISSYGEADKDKVFAVKFNPKSATANIRLADDGRLTAVNAEPLAERPYHSLCHDCTIALCHDCTIALCHDCTTAVERPCHTSIQLATEYPTVTSP